MQVQGAKKKGKAKKTPPLLLALETESTGKLKEGKDKEYVFTLDKKREVEVTFTVKKGNNKKNAKLSYTLYKKKKKKVRLSYDKEVRSNQSDSSSYILPKGRYKIKVSGAAGYRYKILLRDVTKQPKRLKVLQKKYTIDYKKTEKLQYEVRKPKAEFVGTDSIVWRSTKEKVATVENGVVKANHPGKCKVIALLQNGKSYQFTIKVRKLKFDQKVYHDDFSVGVGSVVAEDGIAEFQFINRFVHKRVKKVFFSVYQYDAKGKRIKSGTNSKVKRSLKAVIEPQKYVTYAFGIHPDVRWLRVCVDKVVYRTVKEQDEKKADVTKKAKDKTWKSSYHKKWIKKYKNFYSKKFEKKAKKAAKKKAKKKAAKKKAAKKKANKKKAAKKKAAKKKK